MHRLALPLLGVALMATICFAQTPSPEATPAPRPVSLCDLIQNPNSYNAQWISVHAGVSMEFEDFSLYDAACDRHGNGVWLTFGGDQGEITTYCCVNPAREKGVDVEVEGHRVPLVRDESLREFLRVLQTARLRRPDGLPCYSDECYFYRPVSATITGLFFAGQDGVFPGYGHLGGWHLLAISQVSDVSAKRTPVPAGGEFSCSKKTWIANPADSRKINGFLECSGPKELSCDEDLQRVLSAHWGDQLDTVGGHWNRDYIGTEGAIGGWFSNDLLTSYAVVESKRATVPNISIVRQQCVPASGHAPKAPSEAVSCSTYEVSWQDDDVAAKVVESLFAKNQFEAAAAKIADASTILGDGDQSWRSGPPKTVATHALNQQARKWGIDPDAELQFNSCDDSSLAQQRNQLVGCGWNSRDGMQSFWVTMQKPKSHASRAAGRNSSWVVTEIGATVCY